ncbi:DUF4238 domain-containing protein [Alcanivorax sp.]|uniref:DUF4238 domain-containing protein n=1 Tax=Alcanivorax sp. TaxID=1872427 RepID=UPI002B274144|nr:DUF4238 domain-containing protein [Alcanivorax sp.]
MARHHFVPQFYLKGWYGKRKTKLWAYTHDYHGNVISKLRSAKEICHSPDLYTVEADGLVSIEESSEEVERDFFGPIDNKAAVIYRKIKNKGIQKLTSEERRDWAKFIVSLNHRSPKSILSKIDGAANAVASIIDKAKGEFLIDDDSEIGSLINNVDVNSAAKNGIIYAMTKIISEEKTIDDICSKRWVVADVDLSMGKFISGDYPVVYGYNNKDKSYNYLALSLGPSKLMIMLSPSVNSDRDAKNISLIYNEALVRQAEKFIISEEKLENTKYIDFKKLLGIFLKKGGIVDPESGPLGQ